MRIVLTIVVLFLLCGLGLAHTVLGVTTATTSTTRSVPTPTTQIGIIKDAKKKALVLQINDGINEASKHYYALCRKRLESLKIISTQIKKRVDAIKGYNASSIYTLLSDAELNIKQIEQSITTPDTPYYSISIKSESTLASEARTTLNGLVTDITRMDAHFTLLNKELSNSLAAIESLERVASKSSPTPTK
ncbi:hypothetical protein HGB07_06950 [Candidatus Roizmanbacteria bacterium]|nr:hypothetical protein [Candidatus Roizmanbacteria bacterium]